MISKGVLKALDELHPMLYRSNPLIDLYISTLMECKHNLGNILLYFIDYDTYITCDHDTLDNILHELKNHLSKIYMKYQYDMAIQKNKEGDALDYARKKRMEIHDNIVEEFKAKADFELEDFAIVQLVSSHAMIELAQLSMDDLLIFLKEHTENDLLILIRALVSNLCKLSDLESYLAETRGNFYNKNEVSFHAKGGLARKEKYESKKKEALKMFNDGNFRSYAECARAIYESLDIKDPNTISKWLSEAHKNRFC